MSASEIQLLLWIGVLFAEGSAQKVWPDTGLHPNQRWAQIGGVQIVLHYDLATAARCDEVEDGLAYVSPDRLNLWLTLDGDDPPSGFLPAAIITQLGLLGGGPSHYRHFTHSPMSREKECIRGDQTRKPIPILGSQEQRQPVPWRASRTRCTSRTRYTLRCKSFRSRCDSWGARETIGEYTLKSGRVDLRMGQYSLRRSLRDPPRRGVICSVDPKLFKRKTIRGGQSEAGLTHYWRADTTGPETAASSSAAVPWSELTDSAVYPLSCHTSTLGAIKPQDGHLRIQRLKGWLRTDQPLIPHTNPLLNEKAALLAWAAGHAPDQLLFDISRQNVDLIMKDYCADAGICGALAHAQVLKYSLAMAMLGEGVPLPMLQRRLGHKSLASTGQYLRVSDGDASAAAQKALATKA